MMNKLLTRCAIIKRSTCHPIKRTLSVSAAEVEKFSKLSPTWWDPDSNPLVKMNPARIARMRSVIEKHRHSSMMDEHKPIFHGLKALDIGCGGGLLSESLARLGADVTAIDPSREIAELAQQHALRDKATSKINYRGGMSVEELAEEMNAHNDNGGLKEDYLFDMVCILEVIEHATDPDGLFAAASSLLKKPTETSPGGVLFVSTMNKTAKSYIFAILGAEYVTGMLPIGTHDWNNFFAPQDVESMLRVHDLVQIDVCGMVLKPFAAPRIEWDLNEGDTDVNWIGSYTFAI